MPQQPEATGVGDAGVSGVFRQLDRLAEIAAADAQQDGSVALIHQVGRSLDVAQQDGERRVRVPRHFVRGGQARGEAGIGGIGRDCLGEARDGVDGAVELQQQDTQQSLGGGNGTVEHDGFGGVARGTLDVAALTAQLGAPHAQAGVFGVCCDGGVQFKLGRIGVICPQRETGAEVGQAGGARAQALRRREQRPGGTDAASGHQLRGARGEGFEVSGGLQSLHGGPLLGCRLARLWARRAATAGG